MSNAIINSLISTSLGEIPEIGPFLSGIFDAAQPNDFNAELLSTLDSIENSLQTIEAQLTSLELDLEMINLYGETKHAQARIDTWYTNHVKYWLNNENANHNNLGPNSIHLDHKMGVGLEISQECGGLLDNINMAISVGYSALPGGGGPSTDVKVKWLELVIQKLLATSAEDRFKHQKDSMLELTYRYFLKLIHLQMKGLCCLRAVNYPDLGLRTAKLRSDIIEQGIACQQIVNSYLSNDQFTWVGDLGNATGLVAHGTLTVDNENSSRWANVTQTDASSSGISNLPSNATVVASGVELNWPAPGAENVQWGLQLASAAMDLHGNLSHNSSWPGVQDGEYFCELVPSADGPDAYTAVLNWCSDDFILPVGHVFTGIQLQVQQFREPGMDIYVNNLYAIIYYNKVNPDGSLGPKQSYQQDVSKIVDTQTHYVTCEQFSFGNLQPSSPITGFGFVEFGQQIGVKYQTSIHQNAFSPVEINAGTYCTFFNSVAKTYLTAGSAAAAQMEAASFGQNQAFVVVGLSTTPTYGDVVQITCTDNNSTTYLSANSSGLSFAASNQGNASSWKIVNPNDMKAATSTIYNWSSVLLQCQDESLTDRYLFGTSGDESVELGTPDTSTHTDVVEAEGTEHTYQSKFFWVIRPGVMEG